MRCWVEAGTGAVTLGLGRFSKSRAPRLAGGTHGGIYMRQTYGNNLNPATMNLLAGSGSEPQLFEVGDLNTVWQVAAIPEPSILMLILLTCLTFIGLRRRR